MCVCVQHRRTILCAMHRVARGGYRNQFIYTQHTAWMANSLPAPLMRGLRRQRRPGSEGGAQAGTCDRRRRQSSRALGATSCAEIWGVHGSATACHGVCKGVTVPVREGCRRQVQRGVILLWWATTKRVMDRVCSHWAAANLWEDLEAGEQPMLDRWASTSACGDRGPPWALLGAQPHSAFGVFGFSPNGGLGRAALPRHVTPFITMLPSGLRMPR